MEVKIKQGDEMMDATIEMINGIMVVSPLVVNYKPNNGEVVTITTTSNGSYTCFYKAFNDSGVYAYGGLNNLYNMLFEDSLVCIKDRLKNIYPANEPERKRLFDKIAEEGLEWDTEKREFIKLKWKPADYEKVYVAGFTFYGKHPFCPFEDKALSDSMQWRAVFERGWYFKTQEECQAFCDRLNEAINSVKP